MPGEDYWETGTEWALPEPGLSNGEDGEPDSLPDEDNDLKGPMDSLATTQPQVLHQCAKPHPNVLIGSAPSELKQRHKMDKVAPLEELTKQTYLLSTWLPGTRTKVTKCTPILLFLTH